MTRTAAQLPGSGDDNVVVPGDHATLHEHVLRAREGDSAAVEAVVAALRPSILRYAAARLPSREAAEDAAQEALLGVFEALPTYDERGIPIQALAFRIVHHKVVDHWRSPARTKMQLVADVPESRDPDDGPEELLERRERIAQVTALLGRLPELQREVLLLRIAGGLSAQETAEVMGSSAGAVRVMQHRALARLRQLTAEARAPQGDHDVPVVATAVPVVPTVSSQEPA